MTISPIKFFGHLRWIDERPLMDVIEPYRQRIFTETLYTFGEDGRPHFNLALTGRGKKNWKSADLILAALYRFLAWESPHGNDCFLLANDEGQAGDRSGGTPGRGGHVPAGRPLLVSRKAHA
jgi:hypothetical protein